MKVPASYRFKNATSIIHKVKNLKDTFPKRTKLILLASAVSFLVITGGFAVVHFSSNSHTHLTHSYNPNQQDNPLAPSTKIATVSIPQKPVLKANTKELKNPEEQVKEIISIKENNEQSKKDDFVPLHEQTNSTSPPTSINKTISEHPQQPTLISSKEMPHEDIVTQGSNSKIQVPTAITNTQAQTSITQEKSNTSEPEFNLPSIPLAVTPTQEANSISKQESQKLPLSPTNSNLDIPLDISSDQKLKPIPKQEEEAILNLLTREATLIRNLSNKTTALEKQIQTQIDNNKAESAKASSEIEDLRRRTSLLEANKAVELASDPITSKETSGTALPPSEPIKLINYQANSRNNLKKGTRKKPLGKEDHKETNNTPNYSIQAASPDMAMLIGTNGARLQVTMNSEIPGYGRVKHIRQKGTAWYIVAEKGIIQ